MAVSKNSIIHLVSALTSESAGNELALAINGGLALSSDTFERLVIAMTSREVALNIQAAILGIRPLTARDLFYMECGFSSAKLAAEVALNITGGVYLPANAPASISMPSNFTLESEVSGVPRQQIVELHMSAGSFFASTGPGGYVTLYNGGNANKYYVWYNVIGGSNTDPAPAGFTGIQVNINPGDTAAQVATATYAALNGNLIAMTPTVNGSLITVTAPLVLVAPISQSLPGGIYSSAQSVALSSTTPGAAFYYTTNGATPTTASTLYSGPINVAASLTLKVLQVAPNFINSPIVTTEYVIDVDGVVNTPTFGPVAGGYGPTQNVTISSTTPGAAFYYTTNGDTPTIASSLYSGPVAIAASATLKVLATKSGMTNSAVGSAAYVINGAVATPTFNPVAGSYGSTQNVTVSSVTAGATFYYTTNGSTPTTASTLYSGPISVAADQTLKVLAVKSGFSNSAIATAAYVIAAGPAAVNLLTAANYAILSEAGIDDAGTSSIVGDIAVSPIASTAITGFSLAVDGGGTFATSTKVSGQVFAANYAAPTPATLTQAISDKNAAYSNAAGRTSPDFTNLGSGEIGSLTLVPGLYKWTTGVTISNHLTFNGGPNDVWILQISGTLGMSAAKNVILTGGAKAENIFWQFSGAATIGTTATFKGIMLGATAITFQTGATHDGRIFAGTAANLDSNVVTEQP